MIEIKKNHVHSDSLLTEIARQTIKVYRYRLEDEDLDLIVLDVDGSIRQRRISSEICSSDGKLSLKGETEYLERCKKAIKEMFRMPFGVGEKKSVADKIKKGE
mgnify:CR=1 FL=1